MKHIIYSFITTKHPGPFISLFRILLTPLKWLYVTIIYIRNLCYDLGISKQTQLPCTVISIGNIVVGGTGKTPATATIANLLHKKGYKVVILLRGYGRSSSEKISIVSDGEKCLCSRIESGDEAYLLAHQLNGIPIIVGKNRFDTGKIAYDHFNCDIILLDDGYQHRKLTRDIDILTIDATQPFGTGTLLPIGTLREPISSLKRASIILLTRTDSPHKPIEDLKNEIKRYIPNSSILDSIHHPTSLYELGNHNWKNDESQTIPLKELEDKRILAVCGIGNPDAFKSTIQSLNPESIQLIPFPDHHIYSDSDIEKIVQKSKQVNAQWVVTTQKDEDKLATLSQHIPVFVLSIELIFTDGKEVLLNELQAIIH
ncbi:tetraacyldisaccharide 4'-kinase [Candidatus Poribacteria bacterium]|nr:tetraacyldisaccharide 4'-kinase [Candidatus Poribacteria bacterium]